MVNIRAEIVRNCSRSGVLVIFIFEMNLAIIINRLLLMKGFPFYKQLSYFDITNLDLNISSYILMRLTNID